METLIVSAGAVPTRRMMVMTLVAGSSPDTAITFGWLGPVAVVIVTTTAIYSLPRVRVAASCADTVDCTSPRSAYRMGRPSRYRRGCSSVSPPCGVTAGGGAGADCRFGLFDPVSRGAVGSFFGF